MSEQSHNNLYSVHGSTNAGKKTAIGDGVSVIVLFFL